MKRIPWLTLALASLAIAVHAIPSLTLGWQLDRDAIVHGQVWRFFTAHLTHFGADHLRWDLIAFVVLGTIAERISRSAFLVTLGISAWIISTGVWLAHPELATYRGLSGIDSALYGMVVASLLTFGWRNRDWLAISGAAVALACFAAKSAFEFCEGTTVFVENTGAFIPVPLAHLLGLAVGTIMGISRHRRLVDHAAGSRQSALTNIKAPSIIGWIYIAAVAMSFVYLFFTAHKTAFCGLPAIVLTAPWSLLLCALLDAFFPEIFDASLIPGILLILISAIANLALLNRISRASEK